MSWDIRPGSTPLAHTDLPCPYGELWSEYTARRHRLIVKCLTERASESALGSKRTCAGTMSAMGQKRTCRRKPFAGSFTLAWPRLGVQEGQHNVAVARSNCAKTALPLGRYRHDPWSGDVGIWISCRMACHPSQAELDGVTPTLTCVVFGII